MDNIYESRRLLDEYLLFHYGKPEEVLPWDIGPSSALDFARRTVHELISPEQSGAKAARALDLGCAVGRSSFELTAFADDVLGVDFSQSFVDAADVLVTEGRMPFRIHEEASRYRESVAEVPPGLDRSRARFKQGDAMDLPSEWRDFDMVHAANLLCRLPDPLRCVGRFATLVAPGGQLLLTTPCTWLEEFTPTDAWPEEGSTLDWLHHQLDGDFELEDRRDMPFLIREHARKFQWTVALGMRWRRKLD